MNNIEWLWTMKKPQVPLAQGLHVLSIPLMKENLKIKKDLPIKHIDGDIYFGKKALEDIRFHLNEEFAKDPTLPDKIERKVKRATDNLHKAIQDLKKNRPLQKRNDELIDSFMSAYQAIAGVTAFMSFKGTVQLADIISEKIRMLLENALTGAEIIHDTFLLMSLPTKNSFMLQEQKSILKIGNELQKGSKITTQLKRHTEKFGWMGCVMYHGRPYTYQHFQKELKQAIKKDCLGQLKELEKNKRVRERKIKERINEFKFSKKDLYLYKQFRIWMHLRTYIKDMTSVGMEPTIPLLDEMAKRLGVKYIDLLYLSHAELKQVFTTEKKNLILESRARQSNWGMIIRQGKVKYYNHKTVNKIKEDELNVPAGVKGFPVYPGVVKGNAVVVRSIEDLEQIKQGDILITYMTTTNYVPLLSKVSAIVTDEGGITCHAAIVSREMNIPCIVGTKTGTKSFKNGDVIEVDAKKGIVKKL